MSQRDYREAWAWVHLMLHGPEPGKSILMGYLTQADRAETKARLRPRLAEAKLDEDRLVRHLNGMQTGPIAAQKPRETGAVRFQDQTVEPIRPAPVGLVRRLGRWLGFSSAAHGANSGVLIGHLPDGGRSSDGGGPQTGAAQAGPTRPGPVATRRRGGRGIP